MPEKDITTYLLLTPIWVIILAMAGGFVAFIRRLNKSTKPEPLPKVFVKLAGELFISGFAGVITYLLCDYWGLAPNLTAVFVGVSGHLGGNAIDKITKMWEAFVEKQS